MKEWKTKDEADALDAVITLFIQYNLWTCGNIDAQRARPFKRVVEFLEEYGVVYEVEKLTHIPVKHSRSMQLNVGRWQELREYRSSID